MVVPVVIFFCIALLVHFSHISNALFVVLDQQRQVDRMFSADSEALRCVRVLERSLIQQGDAYFKEMGETDRPMYLYSLPNTYRCKLGVSSLSGYTYEFTLELEPFLGMLMADTEDYADASHSDDVSKNRYAVYVTLSDEDALFIKHILISN